MPLADHETCRIDAPEARPVIISGSNELISPYPMEDSSFQSISMADSIQHEIREERQRRDPILSETRYQEARISDDRFPEKLGRRSRIPSVPPGMKRLPENFVGSDGEN